MHCMMKTACSMLAALAIIGGGMSALSDEKKEHEEAAPHPPEAQSFVHGAPADPSEPWLIAAGGRIYDNWWEALDRKAPENTHPSYPTAGKKSGKDTWRCKECHGWDYKGKDGVYAKGSHYTGIKGIEGAKGKPVAEIMNLLRSSLHRYTEDMIRDDELERVAIFVSRGQIDMSKFIDLKTRKIIAGDLERGRGIFQTVCAACHGFDGRLLNWGTKEKPAYVGTEASSVPDEVMNKILNSHPGVQMVNLRAFPLQDAIDVLAYAATLPVN